MCLYPRMLVNRKYVPNKKNGGIVPAIPDPRVMYVPIGCQYCIECRKQKARSWQVRLLEEIKHNTNGVFVTLTFSNDSIKKLASHEKVAGLTGYDLDNGIAKLGVRLFLERWRKKYKTSVRHWFITELGHDGTENIHLHGFIFTDHWQDIAPIWGYGFVWDGNNEVYGRVNYVSPKTVSYVIKYVTKIDEKHLAFMPRVLCSPGIGRGYDHRVNKFKGKETVETYRTDTGHKISLPIYYRNKAYSEKEREKLWINRIDSGFRYVCGSKVDIRYTRKDYWNLLEYHRKRQLSFGYKPPDFVWSAAKYENERRAYMMDKRLGN